MPNPSKTYHFDLFENRVVFLQQDLAKEIKMRSDLEKENKILRDKIRFINSLSRKKKK